MSELPDRFTLARTSSDRAPQSAHRYRIVRKGSRYNIIGPEGRIFTKYKSASTAGPRWEELTHTPWPHKSSAYESGLRLWELGVITRDQIGKATLPPQRAASPRRAPTKPQAKTTTAASIPERQPKRADSARPVKIESAERTQTANTSRRADKTSPKPGMPTRERVSVTLHLPPALPAPAFDLARQQQLIAALRKDPRLLFHADVQDALRREVEYHRPYARWANKLLRLLARYNARQRSQAPASQAKQKTIMARHIAWQEQRLRETAATS